MKGFSCHYPEILFGMAAIMNGASFIEYHCTMDRKWRGSDQKISLIPKEYAALVDWYEKNKEKLGRMRFKNPLEIPKCELSARKKLWSCA
jgi:N-acetylneuraminate synthase